jgi:ceramide glucosyltransferase
MCFRKSMAERFGGLRTLAQYIAEDNMLGESMKKLGLRVVVMKDPVSQHIGSYDFATFWSRHIRWGRIRKSQVPVIFFLEPLVNALLPGLMGAIASNFFWRIPVEVFLMSHLGFWFLCDLLLMRRLNENLNPMSILAWWFREVLSIPHWIHMACGSTVSWRGQKLKLRKGGVVSPMDIKVNTDE